MKKIKRNVKFNLMLDNHLNGNVKEYNKLLMSLNRNDLIDFCIFTTQTVSNFLKSEG